MAYGTFGAILEKRPKASLWADLVIPNRQGEEAKPMEKHGATMAL